MTPATGGPATGTSTTRAFGWGLAAIVLTGIALRAAFVLVVDPQVPALGDASAYHLLANHLADGRGYVRPFDLSRLGLVRQTAEYPPALPALLAVAAKAGARSVQSQRLVLAVLGGLTVALVGLLGRRVAGPATGLVAAGIAAVAPQLFLPEATLMTESVFACAVVLALLLAYRALDHPTAGRFALLGLVLGVATLARAEGLLLALVLVIPLAWRARDARPARRVLLGACALGATALLVVPWTVRNAVELHAFVPVSNNLGTVLDGANCPLTYSGSQLGLWRSTFGDVRATSKECFEGFDVRRPGFDEAAASRTSARDGLSYARHHAGRLPVVVPVRVLRAWGLYAPRQQVAVESFEGRPQRWQRAATAVHWILLPLAIAGLVVLVRRRTPVWPLLAPVVVATVTIALTYGNQRFRIAADPVLVILAATALTALARAALAPRPGPGAVGA